MTTPMLFTVAPNGARLGKSDHNALPIEARELADCAEKCLDAGAAMIHLHVRDQHGRHSLDADLYRQAIAAVRDRVKDNMVIQVTTEAVGIYQAHEQRDLVRDLCPEAVSLGLRELLPEGGDEAEFAEFWAWMRREAIWPQLILYDGADVMRFAELRQRGIFGDGPMSLLFVLGRYGKQVAEPIELIDFLKASSDQLDFDWSVCAFGPNENACVSAAACFGGHARVGFENNRFLVNGEVAAGNEALVEQAVCTAKLVGRRPILAHELRNIHNIQ